MMWASMCVVGWLSAVVAFLNVGLGDARGPLVRSLASFIGHLGDGHPLRGLGLPAVLGLSVAFDITVLMVGGLVVTAYRTWRLRSQQRTVLDLVAEARDTVDGVCLLKHPYPMAYYLPGDGGRIVLSTGAVAVLAPRELEAVIAHEVGHRNGRHGSWLVPLQVLSSFVSFLPLARFAPHVMRSYLEMSADDYARSSGSTDALRTALKKATFFQPAPRGALGAVEAVIDRRINRLSLEPAPRGRMARYGGSAVVVALLCYLVVLSH
jgi:Zn-dependent protease with chaperone function